MTSFATELATPSFMDVRTDTLPRLVYKDYFSANLRMNLSVKKNLKIG